MSVTVYHRYLFVGDGSQIVFQTPLRLMRLEEAVALCSKYEGQDYGWKVRILWQGRGWNYDKKTPGEEQYGVEVTRWGRDLDDGYYHYEWAPMEICYDNKWDFTDITIDIEQPSIPPWIYVSNLGELIRVFTEMALNLRPQRLTVATDRHVFHPLNFYLVYHRCLNGYVEDLRRMLHMHEVGGGYSYEGIRKTSWGPCKDSFDGQYSHYGSGGFDIDRPIEEAVEISQRLDGYVKALGLPEPGRLSLPDEKIYETLILTDGIEVRELGESLALIQPDLPFRYLEAPYLRLFEVLCDYRRALN